MTDPQDHVEKDATTKRCPYCAEDIKREAIKCRFCGSLLVSDSQGEAHGSVTANAIPATASRSAGAVIGTLFMLLVTLWMAMHVVMSWIAYEQSFTYASVPLWNSLVALALMTITAGVFMKQEWAREWGIGTSALNGVVYAYAALTSGAAFLWTGVLIHIGAVTALIAARKEFLRLDATQPTPSARLSQLLTLVALTGLVIVNATSGRGTEHGREALATDMKKDMPYGVTDIRVDGLDLRIDVFDHPALTAGTVARSFREVTETTGRNSKVWLVGFKRIVITDRTTTEIIAPDAESAATAISAVTRFAERMSDSLAQAPPPARSPDFPNSEAMSPEELALLTSRLDAFPSRREGPYKIPGYDVRAVDLNDDGTMEYIASAEGRCGSGGCDEVVIMRHGSQWRKLADNFGAIEAVQTRTNGFRDLVLYYESDGNERSAKFVWKGSRYGLVAVQVATESQDP